MRKMWVASDIIFTATQGHFALYGIQATMQYTVDGKKETMKPNVLYSDICVFSSWIKCTGNWKVKIYKTV